MQSSYALRPSRYFSFLLIGFHLAVLTALILVSLPGWVRISVLMVLAAHLAYWLLRSALLRLPSSCVSLQLQGDMVELRFRNGSLAQGLLLPDTLVSPLLVLLNMQVEGRWEKRSVVIFPDAMDREAFRTLRVALRWQR